jgi:hypothetical protein
MVAWLTRIDAEQVHQLARRSHRQAAQHDRVEHAEDRGVGADAKGQDRDGDEAEGRRTAQGAERVAQVVHGRRGYARSAVCQKAAETPPARRDT